LTLEEWLVDYPELRGASWDDGNDNKCVMSDGGRNFETMWGKSVGMGGLKGSTRSRFEPSLKGHMIITILSSMTRMSRGGSLLGRGLGIAMANMRIQFLRYRSVMGVDGDDESSVFSNRKDGAPK